MIKLSKSSIYEKIENKGAQDALEINRIGQERATELEETTLQEVQEEIAQMISKAERASEERIITRSTQIEQQARGRSLLRKKEIIKETFQAALEELKKLNNESFKKLVINLIKKDGLTGNEVIKVAKSDFDRFLRIFSNGKKVDNYYIIDRISDTYQLRLSPDALDIDGGFFVIGENFDIDHSYQSIISNAADYYETEVAKILFDGE